MSSIVTVIGTKAYSSYACGRNNHEKHGNCAIKSGKRPGERNMTIAEMVYEQVKALPDQLAREVLDFVVHLRDRRDNSDWRDLMNAQSGSLVPVWDNAEDKVWDDT